MDRTVKFQTGTVTKSARGAMDVTAFSDVDSAWAKIIYGRGEERRRSGKESAELMATVRVRANIMTRAINTGQFVLFDGNRWNITSAAPYKRTFIDFTVKRKTGS